MSLCQVRRDERENHLQETEDTQRSLNSWVTLHLPGGKKDNIEDPVASLRFTSTVRRFVVVAIVVAVVVVCPVMAHCMALSHAFHPLLKAGMRSFHVQHQNLAMHFQTSAASKNVIA